MKPQSKDYSYSPLFLQSFGERYPPQLWHIYSSCMFMLPTELSFRTASNNSLHIPLFQSLSKDY